MMKTFLPTLALLCIFLCGCGSNEKKAVEKEDDPLSNVDTTAAAPPADVRLNVTKTDSLLPAQAWEFDLKGSGFPSQSDECVVKGFDTDGKGRFYFMGGDRGSEATLACYKDGKQEWARKTGTVLDDSYDAIFQLWGDSIYFVNEKQKTLFSAHKDGKGAMGKKHLNVASKDTIIEGRFIGGTTLSALTQDDKGFGHNAAYYFTLGGKLTEKCEPLSREDSLYLYRELKQTDLYLVLYYYTTLNDKMIYITPPEYDNGSVVVYDRSVGTTTEYVMKRLPDLALISGEDWYIGTILSRNLRKIYGKDLYVPGFNTERTVLTVLRYDLSEILK